MRAERIAAAALAAALALFGPVAGGVRPLPVEGWLPPVAAAAPRRSPPRAVVGDEEEAPFRDLEELVTPPRIERVLDISEFPTPPAVVPLVTPEERDEAREFAEELEDLRVRAGKGSALPPRAAQMIAMRLFQAIDGKDAELRLPDWRIVLQILDRIASVHSLSKQARVYMLRTLTFIPSSSVCRARQLERGLDIVDLALYGPSPMPTSVAVAAWCALDAFARSRLATQAVFDASLRTARTLIQQSPGSEALWLSRALRNLETIVMNGASSLDTIAQVVEIVESIAHRCPASCRLVARDALVLMTRRLTADRGLAVHGEARAALAARSFVSAARLDEGFGFEGESLCANLLEVISEARSPVVFAAPALLRAGLPWELIQRIAELAAVPALAPLCAEAIARCTSVAISEESGVSSRVAVSMLGAVCADSRQVRLEAAQGFAAAVKSGDSDAWRGVDTETLERVAGCLETAPGEEASEAAVRTVFAIIDGMAALLRQRPQRSRRLIRHGLRRLCVVARSYTSAAPGIQGLGDFEPRLASVCSAPDIVGARRNPGAIAAMH